MPPKRKAAAAAAPVPAAPADVPTKSAAAAAAPKRRRVTKAAQPKGYYLFGWGSNFSGVLGRDSSEHPEAKRPALVDIDGKRVVSVGVGGLHTVALTEDNSIYTWGGNDEAALGRKTAGSAWHDKDKWKGNYPIQPVKDEHKLPDTPAEQPGRVEMPPEAGTIIQVVAGDGFCFALNDQGYVYGWGCFKEDSDSFYGFSPKHMLQRTPCEVYKPETVRDRVTKLAAGSCHVAALTRKGDVLTWGVGYTGQLGRVPKFGADMTVLDGDSEDQVKAKESAKHDHVRKNLAPAVVPGVDKAADYDAIVDIFCSPYSTFCVSKRGAVVVWGLNNCLQLGVPNGLTDEQARQAEEAIAAAGAGGSKQMQGSSDSEAKWAAENAAKRAALEAAGKPVPIDLLPGHMQYWSPVRADFFDGYEPAAAGGGDGWEPIEVAAIAGGEKHTLVLTTAGQMLAWGSQLYGCLGVEGLEINKNLLQRRPRAVARLEGLESEAVTSISAGSSETSGCVTASGVLWLWGSGHEYMMAKGEDDDEEAVPVKVRRTKTFGHRKVVSLHMGKNYAMLLATEDVPVPP
jgi:regulator of chromosome condensation